MDEKYMQRVVWLGTILGDSTTEEFEEWFLNELGYHVKYDYEFKMDGGHFDGLNCLVFGICGKEIPKFALFRITTGDMKWLEDFCENEKENIPQEVFERYNEYLN